MTLKNNTTEVAEMSAMGWWLQMWIAILKIVADSKLHNIILTMSKENHKTISQNNC